MKQHLPIESIRTPLVIAILVTIACAGCVTMPRNSSSPVRLAPAQDEAPTRMNINSASAAELETLPGIGQTVAERIVLHRQQHGAFRRLEHLMMVRGISEQKFRAIRHKVTVK